MTKRLGWIAGHCKRISDGASIYVKRRGEGYVYLDGPEYFRDPGFTNLEDVSSGQWKLIEREQFRGGLFGRWGTYEASDENVARERRARATVDPLPERIV